MAPKLETRHARRLGEVGLTGWRKPVADAASRPLTKVTPMSRDELRGWVGLGFVVLSAWYLGSTFARFLRER
jgi:hypothetical protein